MKIALRLAERVIDSRCGRGSGVPVLLQLIDERSEVFRAAVVSAPGLGLKVPTCPGRTLLDLVQHLGAVHRTWAATVSAGPGTTPAAPPGEAPDVAFASARGTAAELVLAMYDRIPIDSLQLDGDRRLFDLLRAWE